jgi:hypothetical protein
MGDINYMLIADETQTLACRRFIINQRSANTDPFMPDG